jgi:hypothetical protein
MQFLLADADGSKGVLQQAEFLLLTVERVTQVTCNTRTLTTKRPKGQMGTFSDIQHYLVIRNKTQMLVIVNKVGNVCRA